MNDLKGFELRNARYLAQDALSRLICPGDVVVDATMGNGGDTAFLCRLVGEEGRVYAFDIQQDAVDRTRTRLQEEGLLSRAELICASHAQMEEYVPENAGVHAVMFNLGWLPGGDHAVTTKQDTTLQAVKAAQNIIVPGGLVSICIYPGHEEGKRERETLLAYCSSLPVQQWNVLLQIFANARDDTPLCIFLQKNRQGRG